MWLGVFLSRYSPYCRWRSLPSRCVPLASCPAFPGQVQDGIDSVRGPADHAGAYAGHSCRRLRGGACLRAILGASRLHHEACSSCIDSPSTIGLSTLRWGLGVLSLVSSLRFTSFVGYEHHTDWRLASERVVRFTPSGNAKYRAEAGQIGVALLRSYTFLRHAASSSYEQMNCSIASALDSWSSRGTLLIVLDAFYGVSPLRRFRFDDVQGESRHARSLC